MTLLKIAIASGLETELCIYQNTKVFFFFIFKGQIFAIAETCICIDCFYYLCIKVGLVLYCESNLLAQCTVWFLSLL